MRKNVSFVVGGMRVRGMLHTPDEGKGPWPAVVLCHGFTGSRVESRFLFGGCVAACAAAEAKNLVKSIVLWSPVAVLTEVFKQKFSDDALKELEQNGYVDVGGLALSKEAIEEMDHIDPLHAISQTSCPLLVIHGTQDEVVPYNHASLYCKAARQEGRDIRKAPIRSSDHVYSSLKWRQKVISETSAWFNRTL